MTRARILADTLARLEAERFKPPRRRPETRAPRPAPITAEQAAENAQRLLDATADDPIVVAWTEKETI